LFLLINITRPKDLNTSGPATWKNKMGITTYPPNMAKGKIIIEQNRALGQHENNNNDENEEEEGVLEQRRQYPDVGTGKNIIIIPL
jgi:hypothetical protein